MQPGVRQTGPFLDVIVLETKKKSLFAHTQPCEAEPGNYTGRPG